jgi:histone deacetylase complex regulatory component SIN3
METMYNTENNKNQISSTTPESSTQDIFNEIENLMTDRERLVRFLKGTNFYNQKYRDFKIDESGLFLKVFIPIILSDEVEQINDFIKTLESYTSYTIKVTNEKIEIRFNI